MPRETQIIPEYLVPHVKTYINDNSIYEDVIAEPVDDGVRLLCVFASERGEDRVVKTFTDYREYIKEYGTPNYELYGQPCYMPYVALLSGNAKVHCMRVMPADAAYSNLIIYANIKNEDGEYVKAYFTAKYEEGLTDPNSLQATVDINTNPEADANGYKAYPIIAFRCKGRGKYGNALRVRLTPDMYLDRDNAFKNYILEVIDTGTSGKKELWRGTVYPNSIVSNTSLYIDDIINDPDTGSSLVESYVSVNGIKKVYEAYAKKLEGTDIEVVPESEFDIFGAKTKNGTAIEGYEVLDLSKTENSSLSGIRIDAVNGVAFGGGSEGSFENTDTSSLTPIITITKLSDLTLDDTYSKASPAITVSVDDIVKLSVQNERDEYYKFIGGSVTDINSWEKLTIYADEAMNNEYIAAFTGVHPVETETVYANHPYDTSITSKRRTPAEYIFDANYSAEVKAAIVQLGLKRYDAQVFLDAGIISTIAQAIAHGEEILDYSDCIISKECQCYDIRDPFTGKKITVTSTYFLAANLPNHTYTIGGHVPFIGENYAQLTGHIKNTVRPLVDADDLVNKEALYNLKLNFFECIGENNYIRGTQGTSQSILSDLSEENNVNTLLDMKRQLETLVSSKLYDFSDEEKRKEFTEDAERLFSDYQNTKFREFNVRFDMNEFESTRSILHCYLEVTFRSLAKRGIIEIDINKRT